MRGKKKESALTPGEKLVQALVPDWEQPYKVPENWCWVKLSALSALISKGTTPTGGKNAYVSEGVHFLRVENINDDGTISHDDIACVTEQMHTGFLKRSMLENRDVLVSIAGTLGKTGIVRDVDLPLNTNQAVAFVRLKTENVNERYIKGVIDNPITQELLLSKTKVTSIPNLTLEIIGDCPIPLAPATEQKRIVDRIEYLFAKLDEAKEKAQSVLDRFETRKAAILHKAFTGELTAKWRLEHDDQIDNVDVTPLDKAYDDYDVPHDLPSTWRWVRFNDCCTFVGSGVTPKGGKEVYQTTGVPFIRSQNVLKGTLDLSDVAYITSETDAAMKRTRILGGETLFNITGASIGRACFVPFSQTIGNVNQHVCILRYKNYVVPELPQFWLNSPAVQDFVVGNQIGQTRQALNFKQIRGMYYPLAPLAEQGEIVRILDSLFAKEQRAKDAAEAVLEKIDLLKKSTLARAFRGELGTNDPSEESAVELIKSVLSEKIPKEKPKGRREKTKPEVEFVAKTIMQALSAGGKITPEKLKSETGLLIDDFYDQLKTLIDSGFVIETRVDGESYLEAKNEDRQPNN